MKKIILFSIAVCALPALCLSQSSTTQLPNGVIVHQAQGVEGAIEPAKNEPAKVRTIQDWSLPECMDALTYLEIKMENSSAADRERYLEDKSRVIQRITELKSGK